MVSLEDGGQYTDDMVVGIWFICIAILVACMEILWKEGNIKCFISDFIRMAEPA